MIVHKYGEIGLCEVEGYCEEEWRTKGEEKRSVSRKKG